MVPTRLPLSAAAARNFLVVIYLVITAVHRIDCRLLYFCNFVTISDYWFLGDSGLKMFCVSFVGNTNTSRKE